MFLKNFVVSGSCLHEFEMRYGCVFQKWFFFHQIEKWRDDPEIPKKLFSVLFFGWKYAKSKHMGLCYKSHIKQLILKDAVWLRGNASVPSYHPSRECFGSNTVKSSIFFYFLWFFIVYKLVRVICFVSNALLNISFIYWFCT